MDLPIINIDDIRRAAEFAAEKGRSLNFNPYPVGGYSHDIWAHAYREHVAALVTAE